MDVSRKSLVTYESVASAADLLVSTGKSASVRAVIAVLGGGSNSAVLTHLQTWKAAQPSIKAVEVAIDPRIAAIMGEQIAVTVAEATRVIELRASELEEDLKAVAESGRVAEAWAEELSAELVRVRTENQQLIGKAEALGLEIQQLKIESSVAISEARADAKREREVAELTRQALARAELRLEAVPTLESQLVEARSMLEIERVSRAKAEKEAAVALAEKGSAERHGEECRARGALAEQRESQLRTELAERQATHERTFERLAGSVSALLESKVPDTEHPGKGKA